MIYYEIVDNFSEYSDGGIFVKTKSLHFTAQAAIIAALYAVLTILQNIIFPGSASAAIQFRISEALTILAVFTPAAIPGLTIGCIIANLSSISLFGPLDIIFGSHASLFAATAMHLLRNIRFFHLPVLAALMPALFNGLIIGFEIAFFFTDAGFSLGGFFFAGAFVALGELAVLFLLGLPLCVMMEKSNIHKIFFQKQ